MDLVPCYLSHILIEEQTDSQVVFLAEREGSRRVPIVIGPLEAGAIARAVRAERFSRPLTHDLLVQVIEATGHTCREVRVVDLRDGTFFAELVIAGGEREVVLDCRPSDALAILVRLPDTPLMVADKVLEAVEE